MNFPFDIVCKFVIEFFELFKWEGLYTFYKFKGKRLSSCVRNCHEFEIFNFPLFKMWDYLIEFCQQFSIFSFTLHVLCCDLSLHFFVN